MTQYATMITLEEILQHEPKYRLKQIHTAVYRDMITDWNQASNLPLSLRTQLSALWPLQNSANIFESSDHQTEKALLTLSDNAQIETVLMKYHDHNSVCVSSQVGCPLACEFCATGKKLGFKRNLTKMEIVNQVLFWARRLKKQHQKVHTITFMGMGEPFLNYDNVMKAIAILHDPEGFNLGHRHFSISTSGIVEGIKRFESENTEINLALSLHAPTDTLRRSLMPIANKYSLEELFAAIKEYIHQTKRRVMFEYVIIKDINDSNKEAQELSKLLKGMLCFVNLIPYNDTGFFHTSTPDRIKQFKEILEKNGLSVTQRYQFGDEIHAACGQLSAVTSTPKNS